jgi:hypothetical protein
MGERNAARKTGAGQILTARFLIAVFCSGMFGGLMAKAAMPNVFGELPIQEYRAAGLDVAISHSNAASTEAAVASVFARSQVQAALPKEHESLRWSNQNVVIGLHGTITVTGDVEVALPGGPQVFHWSVHLDRPSADEWVASTPHVEPIAKA